MTAPVATAIVHSIVVPVYRNAGTIDELISVIGEIDQAVEGRLEAIFVIDGSPDDSGERLIARLPSAPFSSRVVEHSRNFGSFPAIRTGLGVARGRHIGVMAADLQEPPELMVTFLRRLSTGDVDVMAGERLSRDDKGAAASKLYWRLYRRFVIPDMPPDGVDVFACTAAVRDVLCRLESVHTSLVAQLFWVGYRRELVSYHRRPSDRPSGWTMARKVRYLLDSVFAFTDLPVRLLWMTGAFGVLVALAVGAVVLGARVAGAITVPGYAPTVLVVLFFSSLNLLGLGIVGSYVYRAYDTSKGRPGAIVRRVHEFANES